MINYSFFSSMTKISQMIVAKRRIFFCILLFVCFVSFLSILLVSAITLDNTLVPGCATVNGSITNFQTGKYNPPIRNENWVVYSYSYNVANKTIESNNWFEGEIPNSFLYYYIEQYSPIGKHISVSYDLQNFSNSYIGLCPVYYGWALMFKVVFGIGTVFLICCLFSILSHYLADKEQTLNNENVPLKP